MVFKGEGVVGAAKDQGKLAFSGQGNAAGATVKVGLDDLPLVVARPYLQGVLRPPLAGALSTDLTLDWKPGEGAPRLRVDARRIAVARLLLGEAKTPELAAEQVELLDAQIDTVARSAAIGKLALQAPRLRLDRDTEGQWNVATWQGAVASASTAPAAAHRAVLGACDHRVRGRRSRAGIGAFCVRAGRVRTLAPEPRHPGDRQGPGQLHRPQPRRARRARPARALAAGAGLGARRRGEDSVPAAHPGRGAGRAERAGGRCRRRRQRRCPRRVEDRRRRPAAERAGDARAQGPAAAPARSLSRRPCPARRAEGADRLSRHGRLGEARPQARASPCAAMPRSTTSAPPARWACGPARAAAAWRWSGKPAPARRCSTGSRCRCAASTSRSRRARGRG